jgi:aminoglycoside phosphotransferase (APT) family kinase protein
VAVAEGDVPGLDLDRFGEFFEKAQPGLVKGPLSAELIAGGKSNLTYEVTDGQTSWILRRPPLGHVLATAHDMAREHRVITALHPTDVPVPATYALCVDTDVIGAPFFVMEQVQGTPYRLASQLEPLGPERVRTISVAMIDTLAELHRLDPAEVGLRDFGRPEGFLERQVRRWKKQLDASHTRDLSGADVLHRLLETHLPQESAPAVVHGDFRLDNLLVDEDRVAAVIDWEMATLGDPLTDVALLLVYQSMGDLDVDSPGAAYVVADASSASGFLSRDELLDRYVQASGRDLSAMGFYVGLAYFKLAVILEGIHYRYTHGQTVGSGFDTVGAVVEPLIVAGINSFKNKEQG